MKLNKSAAIAALLASLFLSACNSENPETMLASAKSYLAKNDSKAALIQVKNALQVSPDLPEARYLLGVLLLDGGNANSAELEFRKALALKYSTDAVIPKLATSMLSQGLFKKLVDEFSDTKLTTPAAVADLQTILASTYSMSGKSDLAENALKTALLTSPDYVPALLLQARLKAANRDFNGAISTVEMVLAKSPKSADAWKLSGDLFMAAKDDPVQALDAYRKAIALQPQLSPAHLAAVGVLVRQGNADEAKKQWDELKKFFPNGFQTKYLEAQIAYLKKDTKIARELSQQLLKLAPDSLEALQMAGSVELQANSLVRAESYLTRAVQLAPNQAFARKLLIMTYLQSGQSAKALSTLNIMQSKEGIPPDQYSIAGEVYLQTGDVKKAEEYFLKASKLDPTDARKRTAVASTRLISGQAEPAFEELKEISASDTGTSADLMLISAHLKRGEFSKALLAIDRLEQKEPGKPLAAILRGRTQLALRDIAGARKSFENALVISPGYFSAAYSLAALDMAEKNPDGAKKRMEAVVAKDPNNSQALLVLAEIAEATGAAQPEIEKLVRKAITANPTDIAPRLRLVNFHLKAKDYKQATAAAQDAVATMPENPNALDSLGQVQQASGENNQAIGTYLKSAALQPTSPQPHMRLAGIYIAAKDNESAERSLRKAIDLKSDLLEAQITLFHLLLVEKRYPESLALARKLQEQRPKQSIGYLLEGDISVAQKDWTAATRTYRAALKQLPFPELAVKLHSILLTADKIPEANAFSNDWRKAHADDALFLTHLGENAIIRQDFQSAKANFIAVTKLRPTDAVAFNNLAWTESQLNGDDAIKYAEIANKLAPNQPAFMDTLATILSSKKEYEKAISLQQSVLKMQPENSLFRMTLAKIYVKSGDKVKAKLELDRLAALGDKFSARAEVESMLKAL